MNTKIKDKIEVTFLTIIVILGFLSIVFIAARSTIQSEPYYDEYCNFQYGEETYYDNNAQFSTKRLGACVEISNGQLNTFYFDKQKIAKEYHKCPRFFELDKWHCELIEK